MKLARTIVIGMAGWPEVARNRQKLDRNGMVLLKCAAPGVAFLRRLSARNVSIKIWREAAKIASCSSPALIGIIEAGETTYKAVW